ncbi:tyrosine-protein phosphatase [Humibacter sp.]|uniref:tyrosine-protein phosphatase n=1 Tax=Humibacter sp. TaxID=1940291 RepID=UPI002CBE0268|nr:tyrosine-protein phosphatase [Humibacter sp.]HVX08281.1 tyrosine-protein phosphatase [Humibacter sp.]
MAERAATGSGDPEARPGTLLECDGVPNLRDVGGCQTSDGRRTRTGLLYRSTALGRASEAHLSRLRERGIRTVFDLRTAAEREAAPDRDLDGATTANLDVMADAPGAPPARITRLTSQPQKASRLLARTDIDATFDTAYRGLVPLPSARTAYHGLFLALAGADALPALYHCTTGKDRTGWATAALLLLLGVSESDVVDDYLLSNGYLLAGLQPVLDGFAAGGGDPELLKPVLGVKARYLQTALAEARERYGTIERYFTDGLGLDAAVQQRLRDTFVD